MLFIRAITKQSSLILNINIYVQYHNIRFINKETKRYGDVIAINFLLSQQQY